MRVFKPGELVRVVSLPWKTYCEDEAQIGDVVTVAHMKPKYWQDCRRFAVVQEWVKEYPHHNIGTDHLRSTGLRVSVSRNKREGQYLRGCQNIGHGWYLTPKEMGRTRSGPDK